MKHLIEIDGVLYSVWSTFTGSHYAYLKYVTSDSTRKNRIVLIKLSLSVKEEFSIPEETISRR